jgi:hypothetical protein
MLRTYYLPMFSRLVPQTPWEGGRMVETDLLSLADAAAMASKHGKTEITQGDFLRAAGRGEILLRAVISSKAVMQPCRNADEDLHIPTYSVPTLPLSACQALANVGLAQWRHIDGYERRPEFGGELCRFIRWQLPEGEQDIVTHIGDCRVMGYDVHALADAFVESQSLSSSASAEIGNTKPISRTLAQETAILAAIKSLGITPLALPVPASGKRGVKAAVREMVLLEKKIFTSPKVFDLAWQRLRDENRIVDASPPLLPNSKVG